MPPRLSRYSEHYRDLDEQQASRALESLQSRLEDFRLRLDLDHILPWIKGPDVLDFPIGTGRFYPHLIGRFNVHGYDIAPRYIERAKALHPEIADRFKLSVLEAPDQGKAFDTVITLRTLARIGDIDAAIRGIASILKSGGRWIFNFPPYEKENFQLVSKSLQNSGLQIINAINYDLHSGGGSSRIGSAAYTRYRNQVENGHIPYWIFKTIDRAFSWRATRLFIVQKTNA